MNAPLRRLAELKGIASAYRDIWGHEQPAADTTLAALLVAMGALDDVDARPATIEAAIAAHQSALRAELLPPVLVRYDDEAAWAPAVPPQAPDGTPLDWRIDAEDGSVRQGRGHAELAAAPRPPAGYHTLSLMRGGETVARCTLIVAPRRAFQPPALLDGGRAWGAAAQLYAVRSARNWGIGDYTDLAELVELWGRQGAGAVGVNPLHAMFPHNPAHASPYSPSSRLFFNALYLDVEAIADYAECTEARELVAGAPMRGRLDALRRAELVDYDGVAGAKRAVLDLLYTHFRDVHMAPRSVRAQEFEHFRGERGAALRRHALFEALQAHFHRENNEVWGWPVWPEPFRDPASPQVRAFESDQLEAVEFYEYLQWQADLQLGDVGRRSMQAGLGVGLFVDLAVSIDRAGAEAWSEQALYALGASIGAPPDDYNPRGQDWGLPPIDPARLRAAAYAPFIATLRANMAHAGALRIDHVMALMRLYWIPPGAAPSDGAYVFYPFDELLAIVALESHRSRCLVVGEDLGTVPDEVRTKLAAAGVLSYHVLFFERDTAGDFKPPAAYQRQSIAVASTHDLPTLAGWWQCRDLELRQRLGLFPTPELFDEQRQERARDRARLLGALQRERLLPAGRSGNAAASAALDAATLRALHVYLARSPAQLVLVQLEDMLLALDAVNLPGTTDQVPNWRRKLSLPLEQWAGDERFVALAGALARERPGATAAPSPPGGTPSPSGTPSPVGPAPVTVRIPRATYRVQLHNEFRFADAMALVPYWHALGISHLYTSPILGARPGSRHGYDVVDHGRLNPELGTREDFDRLVAALQAHGMGLVVDIVPNHMGVLGNDNAWWLDVLENGASSAYAGFFDIDWQSADPALTGKVLLPILGDQYGVVLERGELKLAFEADRGYFTLSYFDHRLPVDPATYGRLLRRVLQTLEGAPTGLRAELLALSRALDQLPPHHSPEGTGRTARQADKTKLKARLAACLHGFPVVRQAIGQVVAQVNGRVGERGSFDDLSALIDAQPYRLAHWRVAGDEINYRRFFDINELAALRMERAEVFEATHRLLLELAAKGAIDGLRLDHPDGLADPAGYFLRLQRRYAEVAGLPTPAPRAEDELADMRLYVVAEKIVAPHEQVPRDWALHGTTGYRFANVVNGVLVDSAAKTRLERIWRVFAPDEFEDFDTLSWQCRHVVMDGSLAGELTVLAGALLRLAREDRRTRDFTLHSLRQALAELVASFPVYRTYIVDKPSRQDRKYIDWAIGRARRRSLAADASVFDFMRQVLLGRALPGAPAGLADRYLAFAQRLQQYTAPVVAKGIEDTALYRHHRLISVNDVGGEPDEFGVSVAAFHAVSRERWLNRPAAMLTTSTHDAKRSEDVRARIDVISELPAAWRLATRRWTRMNRRHKRIVDGRSAPTRNDEYLLYQLLVGSLPAGMPDDAAQADYARRIEKAILKSARESKAVTSWMNPNAAYESALSAFVHALLDAREGNLFLADLQANAGIIAWYGALNGLTLALVKTLSPGVPDYYQGHELIELSLVDPDNRRPVDYERRRESLEAAQALLGLPDAAARRAVLRDWVAQAIDGRAKFWVTWRALQLRRAHGEMLSRAEYLPLEVRGQHAQRVLAFARRDGASWIVVIAGRLFAGFDRPVGVAPAGEDWGDTAVVWPDNATHALPSSPWLEDALTGQRHALVAGALPLAAVLTDLPVAALFGATTGVVPGP